MNELDIFSEALELADPSARAEYLNEACGADSDLRQRIEALLRNAAQASRFLESPPAAEGITTDRPITESAGTQIGQYKLLQQIGEGGMGVVYMAEQSEPVERRVALKIVKPGMDTRQVIARFEAEEQALAMMDHPNIAKVLDAGTTDSGRPFFVMELVKGVPITQYCDQQHLTLRQRLELFIPVCQAVQHAHQKGIIHRDIKPSNILVAPYDGQPVPKVIDFGVAKALSRKLTEKTMFTHYGQIVGTLEYMSPEQANLNQLDIDTRSDIYSLGVLLYELLTGATPFDRKRLRSAAFDEIMRIIREEEPPRPSTRLSTIDTLPSVAANRNLEPRKLCTTVRGELDWIVMKALEKDRARRYETAAGFADDIKRYLGDETVVACPPSAAYRFRKFARRNRVILTTVALVMTALAMGIVGTVTQARRATRSRDRALGAEERAVQNLDRALSAVDKMLTRVADERLSSVPFMGELRRELLQDALVIHQQLLASVENAPNVQLETAMAQRRVADILLQLGHIVEAGEMMHAASELLTSASEQTTDSPQLKLELARIRFLQGRITTDSMETRLEHLGQAAEMLEHLLKDDRINREKKAELAHCLSIMAKHLRSTGNRSEADVAFRRADGIFSELISQDPRNRDVMVSYAKHLQNWALLFMDVGDWKEAESRHRRAVDVGQSLVALNEQHAPSRLTYSVALGNVAAALYRQDRYEEAESVLQDTLEIQRGLVRDYPSFPDYRLRLSGTLMSTAGNCAQSGDIPGGIEHLTEATLMLKFLTDNWPSVREYQGVSGGTLSNLAVMLSRQGEDLERAEKLAKRAIEHQRLAIEDPENPNLYLLQHYGVLAQVQMQRGRTEEALSTCQEGMRIGQILAERFPSNNVVSGTMDKLKKIQDAALTASQRKDGI